MRWNVHYRVGGVDKWIKIHGNNLNEALDNARSFLRMQHPGKEIDIVGAS